MVWAMQDKTDKKIKLKKKLFLPFYFNSNFCRLKPWRQNPTLVQFQAISLHEMAVNVLIQ